MIVIMFNFAKLLQKKEEFALSLAGINCEFQTINSYDAFSCNACDGACDGACQGGCAGCCESDCYGACYGMCENGCDSGQMNISEI